MKFSIVELEVGPDDWVTGLKIFSFETSSTTKLPFKTYEATPRGGCFSLKSYNGV